MYKLEIKSLFFSIITFVISLAIISLSCLIKISAFTIALPVLLVGSLTFFTLINFFIYSRATTRQIVIINAFCFLIFVSEISLSLLGLNFFKLKSFHLGPNLTLSLSIIPIILSLFISIFITYTVLKLKSSSLNEEQAKKSKQAKKAYIKSKKSEEKIYNNKTLSNDKPDISIQDIKHNHSQTNENLAESNKKDIYPEYIPENIRLVENAASKRIVSEGTISSIGKLLVNNRDIENIIELQEADLHNKRDIIITKALGNELNQRLNDINLRYPEMSDLTLSNKAGFTIASIVKDNNREETIGALTSGAFQTLENYFSRLNLNNISKIFFETEEVIHSLFKIEDFIFFFTTNKEFQLIKYNEVKNVLEQKFISVQHLFPLKSLKGIVNIVITDRNGNLQTENNNDSQKLASISLAIFENLKVFIKNLSLSKLTKIIIFTENNILIIKKYDDDNVIILFLEKVVELSQQAIEIENIIK